jgi:hypothetical protein
MPLAGNFLSGNEETRRYSSTSVFGQVRCGTEWLAHVMPTAGRRLGALVASCEARFEQKHRLFTSFSPDASECLKTRAATLITS